MAASIALHLLVGPPLGLRLLAALGSPGRGVPRVGALKAEPQPGLAMALEIRWEGVEASPSAQDPPDPSAESRSRGSVDRSSQAPLGAQASAAAPMAVAPPTTAAPDTLPERTADGDAPTPPPAAQAGGAGASQPLDIPGSFEQVFQVRRGPHAGQATWSWQLQNGRYRAQLRGQLHGPAPRSMLELHWTSTGTLDADGVAPDRYVARAARGGARAVNFERDTGRISYSGPTGQHELAAGAQDRLSWLVQLMALVRARGKGTAPLKAGESFSLWVTGPQGDAGAWAFEVQQIHEDGSVHLTRRAPRRYELEVEIRFGPAPQRELRLLRLAHLGGVQPPWEFHSADP